jgi:hypothetical protein
MKPASAKNKGRFLQKWAKSALHESLPDLQPDDVISTSMGKSGEDLQLSPLARSFFPYSVECKNLSRIVIYKWLEQGVSRKYPPLIIAKGNHKEPIVSLYAVDFFRLIKELNEIKKNRNN